MITWNEVLQIGDSVGVTDVGMATDFVGVGTMVAVVPEAGVEGGVVPANNGNFKQNPNKESHLLKIDKSCQNSRPFHGFKLLRNATKSC